MIAKLFASTALFAFTLPAFAQTDLSVQLGAVNSAIGRQSAREQAERDAAAAEQRRQEEAQAAEEERRERAAEAAQKRHDAIAAADHVAEQKRRDAAVAAQAAKQAKADAYSDQMRDMDLQERRMQLQAEQTRANRENDVINADLARQKAETDVVQSKADATRNISQGSKSLLEDTGKAKVKDASRWFK